MKLRNFLTDEFLAEVNFSGFKDFLAWFKKNNFFFILR